MFEKITSNSLRERIARQIRNAILGGQLQEGSKLVERTLAAELGASLTAVREGLIELEWEGFIVKKKNSGTHVVKLTPPDVAKIFQVREVLEALAFAEAARHATTAQITALERAYREMVEAANNKDALLYNQKDVAFHLVVWTAADNEFLQAALRRAVLPYFTYTAIRIASVDPMVLCQDATAHLPLLEAIRAHDPEAAQKLFVNNVEEWLAIASAELAEGLPAAALDNSAIGHDKVALV
ncbi:MAG TPA: GntR family transcriptional regulator [Bryobacteraceae bacterium]|nr:GntR family transcriptional regulator [Bryobacteraceae bacterium]